MWQNGVCHVKEQKTAFYFYFYLTPTQEEGKAEGDPRVLPQVRHADLSVSVTRGSLNAAWQVPLRGAGAITVSARPPLGGDLGSRPEQMQTSEVVG